MSDAVVTGFATVLGVMLGGWLTYFGTSRLEERRAERQERADAERFAREDARLDIQFQRKERSIRRKNLYQLQSAAGSLMSEAYRVLNMVSTSAYPQIAVEEQVAAVNRQITRAQAASVRVGDDVLAALLKQIISAVAKAVRERNATSTTDLTLSLHSTDRAFQERIGELLHTDAEIDLGLEEMTVL